jgi:hypothetical protein
MVFPLPYQNVKCNINLTLKIMKRIIHFSVFIAILAIISCSYIGSSPVFESKDAIAKLIKELKGQYGENLAIHSLTLAFQPQIGNFVLVEGNNDINSEKLMQKKLMKGVWENESEITMEISDGKPSDFLFTLKDIDLSKLPEIVADAKNRVSTGKKIDKVKATTIILGLLNKVQDKTADLDYTIMVEPENGGTTFTLSYDATGKYLDMVY